MPVEAAIIASSVIGAGSQAVVANRKSRADARIRDKKTQQADLVQRQKVRREKQDTERAKASRKIKEAKVRDIRAQSAARKGITPFAGAGTSESILNEGSNG